MTLPIATPDLIEFKEGKNTFSLLSNDTKAYKIIEYSVCNSKGVWTRFIGNATSIRKIGYFGSLLLRTDGDVYFIPNSNTPDELKLRYTISDFEEGTSQTEVVLKRKVDVIEPPQPTEPKYTWHGGIGNTSKLDWGATKIKSLRTPSAITTYNGKIFIGIPYVEGNSGLFYLNENDPTERFELFKPEHNDYTACVEFMQEHNGIIYVLSSDGYAYDTSGSKVSQLDCFLWKFDATTLQPLNFTNGKNVLCTFQDNNPYNAIAVFKNTKKKPTSLTVIDHQIHIGFGGRIYIYDYEGYDVGDYHYTEPQYMCSSKRDGNSLTMHEDKVTYNGEQILFRQSNVNVEYNTFTPYDYTTFELKGAVHCGANYNYIVDSGNCRIHVFDDAKKVNEIAWIPMSYNTHAMRNWFKDGFAYVTSGFLGFLVNLETFDWVLIDNFSYNLQSEYKTPHDLRNCMRDLINLDGTAYCLVDKAILDNGNWERTPTLFKLTLNGLEKVYEFDMFANIHITKNGDIIQLDCDLNLGSVGKFIDINKGTEIDITPKITEQSCAYKSLGFFCQKDNGEFVIMNPSADAKECFHLEWIKDGQVVGTGLPSTKGTFSDYPKGDLCLVEGVNYPCADGVKTANNKVFVMMINEGLQLQGKQDSQTSILNVYDENRKLIMQCGKSQYEAEVIDGKECPREFTGNSKAGDVIYFEGKYYYFYNCEHTSGINCIVIEGI